MIQVNYHITDDRYDSLSVSGHADFGEYGRDLICAAVSSIIFGFMNALDETGEDLEISQEENEITIIDHSGSDRIQDYFSLVIVQLKTIEESYGQYITIERK